MMDEDEQKLKELQKKIRESDDPSFWDLIQSVWYANRTIMKKQRELNQLRWIVFQVKLNAFFSRLLHKK